MIQIIDTLFNTLLNRIQKAMETSNERERGFTHESVGLLNYYFQKIDIIRAELYIILHQRDGKNLHRKIMLLISCFYHVIVKK